MLAGVLAVAVAGCAPVPSGPVDPAIVHPTVAVTTSGMEPGMLEQPTRSGLFSTSVPGKPAARITLNGTPSAGVEAGCLLLGGYLLIGGPREVLAAGDQITVIGRPDPTFRSICQQGVPLMVESAEPTAATTP